MYLIGKILEIQVRTGTYNGNPYRSVNAVVLVGKSDTYKVRLREMLEVQPPSEGTDVALLVRPRINGQDSGRPYITYESDTDVTDQFYATTKG